MFFFVIRERLVTGETSSSLSTERLSFESRVEACDTLPDSGIREDCLEKETDLLRLFLDETGAGLTKGLDVSSTAVSPSLPGGTYPLWSIIKCVTRYERRAWVTGQIGTKQGNFPSDRRLTVVVIPVSYYDFQCMNKSNTIWESERYFIFMDKLDVFGFSLLWKEGFRTFHIRAGPLTIVGLAEGTSTGLFDQRFHFHKFF